MSTKTASQLLAERQAKPGRHKAITDKISRSNAIPNKERTTIVRYAPKSSGLKKCKDGYKNAMPTAKGKVKRVKQVGGNQPHPLRAFSPKK